MKKQKNSPTKKFHILLGISGGIAAYKCCELVRLFVKEGHSVKVIMTRNATRFVTPLTMETLSGNRVYTDLFRKESFSTEHISLSKWGDILIVAPATANIIGKFAAGIADDILSTLYLSFPKPVVIAPAMHTEMYGHRIVADNIARLSRIGVEVISAETGELASGDVGEGRLPEPAAIRDFSLSLLNKKKELSGKKILITAGPTIEAIDPARFISSPSSGKMGVAIAEEAVSRGAGVVLVHGPLKIAVPTSAKNLPVKSAKEMYGAVMRNSDCDVFISTAAVSDFRPSTTSTEKIKKGTADVVLNLTQNPDILKDFSQKFGKKRIIVGFAAESSDLIKNARAKILSKKLDLIVANDITGSDAGFGSDFNRVSILDKTGSVEKLPLLPKRDVAKRIMDRIGRMLKK